MMQLHVYDIDDMERSMDGIVVIFELCVSHVYMIVKGSRSDSHEARSLFKENR